MLSRINQRILTALLTTLLLLFADVTFHAVVYGWLPSATYQAVAAGGDNLLIDGGSSGSLRVDQLSGVSSVLGTDTFPDCQSCSSGTTLLTATAAKVAAYVASVITTQQNAFVGQQLTPHVLTNASTITVDASASNIHTITLSASGQTMGCPTNVTSGKDATLTFRITQPSSGSPDDLNWNSCYWFPAGTPPRQSNGGLSAANGTVDMVNCDASNVSGTITSYCPFGGSSNFASSAQFLLRGNSTCTDSSCTGSNANCTVGGVTTCSLIISNSMSGDLRTIEILASGAVQATSVTDGTNTCHSVSNAFVTANNASADIWDCPKIVGGSSATIVVTWPSTVTFAGVCVQEWVPSTVTPDGGIGNTASSASGSPSVSTSSATTQVGELVISATDSANGTTGLTGTSLCNFESGLMAQYSTPASLAVATLAATQTSGKWSSSIVGFLHY